MFFLELSCFFDDPADVGNLISGSSAFSKTSLNIWKFTVHIFRCIPSITTSLSFFFLCQDVEFCQMLFLNQLNDHVSGGVGGVILHSVNGV